MAKNFEHLALILICLFYASTCFAIQGADNSAVPTNAPKEITNPARFNASAPTWTTEGGRVPLSVDASGGLRVTGSLNGRTTTGSSAYANITTATTTEIVPLSGTTEIKVYNVWLSLDAGGQTFKFVYGTGTACGTGTTDLTATFKGSLTTAVTYPIMSPNFPIITAPAGKALCITTSSTPDLNITISYVQE